MTRCPSRIYLFFWILCASTLTCAWAHSVYFRSALGYCHGGGCVGYSLSHGTLTITVYHRTFGAPPGLHTHASYDGPSLKARSVLSFLEYLPESLSPTFDWESDEFHTELEMPLFPTLFLVNGLLTAFSLKSGRFGTPFRET